VGSGEEASAKYVVVWKQEDGRWRWDVDIWNMDSA
jgi:ketosteroid isomerase-like protein